jgi:Ser/Thr protein kinase RdoA (MazF antagonist)
VTALFVPLHTDTYSVHVRTRESDIARSSLALFGKAGSLRRIATGLDTSYRVKTVGGAVYALRVSSGMTIRRPSAYSVEAAWIDALSDNPWFRIPRVARTSDGGCIATVLDDQSVPRASTLLSWMEGRRCYRITEGHARALGQMVGVLHQNTRSSSAPPRGAIKSWDATRMCGMGKKDELRKFAPDAIGLVEDVYRTLGSVVTGLAPTEKGLINADVRLHNVLFHQGRAGLVDFNDAGVGPYGFCLGRLTESIRSMSRGAILADELLNGYREVTPLPPAYEQWGGLFELAAGVFKLNFSSRRAASRGTTLDTRELRSIGTLRKKLDCLNCDGQS